MNFSNNNEDNLKSKKTSQFLNEKTPWLIKYGTYIVSAIMIIFVICLLEYLEKYEVVPFKFMI